MSQLVFCSNSFSHQTQLQVVVCVHNPWMHEQLFSPSLLWRGPTKLKKVCTWRCLHTDTCYYIELAPGSCWPQKSLNMSGNIYRPTSAFGFKSGQAISKQYEHVPISKFMSRLLSQKTQCFDRAFPQKTSERVRGHSILTLKFIPEQFISCRLLVDVNRYECGLEHQSNANDVSVQSSFNSYSHEEAHQKGKMCKNSIPGTWRKQGLL